MTENFDYIVVGAGSAGCVLANRLSEDREVRVLLVEAGGKDEHFYIHVPAGFMDIVSAEEIQWRYVSEPEPALDNRRMWQQRGRVLGGSSSINAMMYMRGNPLDYEHWVGARSEGLVLGRGAALLQEVGDLRRRRRRLARRRGPARSPPGDDAEPTLRSVHRGRGRGRLFRATRT